MTVAEDAPEAIALKENVDSQGVKVRELKSNGASKEEVDEAVNCLLQLKNDYKSLTGVDLSAGGNSKKDKKAAKKAEASKNPPAVQPSKKERKGKAESKTVAASNAPTPRQNATLKPAVSASAPSTVETKERDMNMPAVLARLVLRASQVDQLVTQIRTQLACARQSAAASACKAEEEKLRTENETLRRQVQDLKNRLVQAEISNGVKQVPMPKRSAVLEKPTVTQEKPSAPNVDQPPPEKKGKKEKKGENKEAAATAKGGANSDAAPLDVSRLDMRIGQIVAVKHHPDADSLYVEEVDLDEDKPRTVISGLVKHVPIEQMQDRTAIFMCNLKPAKMRGIFSHGMIMCGSTPEKVEIIVPPTGSKKGDRIYVEGFEGTPDEQLNPKKNIFEQVQPDLRINPDGVAVYKGAPLRVRGVEGLCTVPSMKDTPIK